MIRTMTIEYAGGVEVGAAVCDPITGIALTRAGSCRYDDDEVGRAVVAFLRSRRHEIGARRKFGSRLARFAKNAARKLAKSKALGKIWKLAKGAIRTAADAYTGGAFSRIASAAKKAIAKVAPVGSSLSKAANKALPGGSLVSEQAQRDGEALLLAAAAQRARASEHGLGDDHA